MGNPKDFPFVIKTTKAAALNRRPSPDKMVSMMSKIKGPSDLRT